MEEKKVTTHVTKGLLVALILIVVGVIAHFAGIETQSWYRWIPLAILFFAIIVACINYSSQLNNQVTFGNLFAHGFKMAAVITVILILWSILSILVIFPETKDQAIEAARQKMEAQNKLSDSQIEQALEFTRKFFLVFVIGGALIGTLIVGAIASLVGAGVAKKKPVNPLDQMSI